MARRAHAYPQVMPVAADLVDGAVVAGPATLAASDAARLARRRGAEVLAAGERSVGAARGRSRAPRRSASAACRSAGWPGRCRRWARASRRSSCVATWPVARRR